MNVLDGEETILRKKDAVLFVLDNVSEHLRRLLKLQEYIECELGLYSSEYLIGNYLPRNGILLWIAKYRANAFSKPTTLSEDGILSRIKNRRQEAERSIILYRVPLNFPDENFHDRFEGLDRVRRWTRKGSSEPTEIVELVFYESDDARALLQSRYVKVEGMAFRSEPKFLQRPRICRVCKSINPDHNPTKCQKLVCGKCSGPHATKEHPPEIQAVRCPACKEEHEFSQCPNRSKEITRSLKAQKVLSRRMRSRQTRRTKARFTSHQPSISGRIRRPL